MLVRSAPISESEKQEAQPDVPCCNSKNKDGHFGTRISKSGNGAFPEHRYDSGTSPGLRHQASTKAPKHQRTKAPKHRSTKHLSPSTKHQAPSTKRQQPSTKRQAPSTNHQTPTTKRQAPSAKRHHKKKDRTKTKPAKKQSIKEAANERAEEATKQGRKTVKEEGEAGQDDACKVSTNFGIRKARSAARCPLL